MYQEGVCNWLEGVGHIVAMSSMVCISRIYRESKNLSTGSC